jgi:tripartite-type tricarboxylate transporter receptor subunit TctC
VSSIVSVGLMESVLLSILAVFSIQTPAWSQVYPNRPVHIDTSEPGGGADIFARIIAAAITNSLGQPVVVNNLPGGVVVAQTAASAAPDGYTLIYAGTSFMNGPFFQKTSYNPVTNFVPVAMVAKAPAVLVVNSTVPAKTVREFINLAKAHPGQLNYASATTGSGSHLSMELLKSATGINVVRVPYKGGGQAITAVVSGEAQAMIAEPGFVMPFLQSGKLRALGVTTADRSPLFPRLPPIAETVPGYDWETVDGIWVPAGTSMAVVDKLNQVIAHALNNSDVKSKFFRAGSEAVSGPPALLVAAEKSDLSRIGKLVSDLGIRPQ